MRVTDDISHCLLVLDRTGVIRFASLSPCPGFGVSESELINRHVGAFASELRAKLNLWSVARQVVGAGRYQADFSFTTQQERLGRAQVDVHGIHALGGAMHTIVVILDLKRSFWPSAPPSADELRFHRKYASSSLSYDRGRELFLRMDAFVREGELYRQRKLSVSVVARQLSTNTQYLSQVINYFGGERFPNYINRLRLEWMSRHGDPAVQGRQSAFWGQAGFGSYSAYHRATKMKPPVGVEV